jgi:acetyl-CoA carboxylase carboxyl transferase subunit alpha
LKLTAKDLLSFGLVDRVIDEPDGGAHSDHPRTFENIRAVLREELRELSELTIADLVTQRMEKFYRMGAFSES